MSRKNGGIDIPVAAIVLAYIFCWPVGLVLTILKWVPFNTSSSRTNRTHIPNSPSTQEEQYRQYQEKFEQYRQQQYGQKTSSNTKNSGSTLHTTNTSQMNTSQMRPNTNTQSGPQTQAEQMRMHGNTYSQNQENYNQNSNQYRRRKTKKFKSSVTGFLTFAAIIMLIIGTVSGIDAISNISNVGFEMSFLRDLLMSGYLFAGGGAMFVLRKIIKNRDAMFNRYIAIIGNRESMYIPTIAAAMSVSVKKAKKDIQMLIDKGYFGDTAYLDMSNNNIMMHSGAVPESGPEFDFRSTYDPAVFGDKKYDKSKNKMAEQKKQDDANRQKQPEEAPIEEIKIEDETDFAKILREIRRMNDAIDDEEVSERIYTIENITRNIFNYVGTNTDKLAQIRTFMNYYLPTTLKLLNSYSQIEKMGVAGQNMKNAKDNIEKILDMLVEGFQQQLDQLYKSEVLDISSDIEVLEQMMYKDGLAEKTMYDMFGGSGAATVSNPEDEEFPLE